MTPRIHVLVVDDEGPVRTSLVNHFEDAGFVVSSADCAETALELLERGSPDVAVVDMRLPGMDGNQFIHRAHKLNPALAFLIFTGSTDYVLPQSMKDIGVRSEDVYRKPLHDLGTLSAAVQQAAMTKDRGDANGADSTQE